MKSSKNNEIDEIEKLKIIAMTALNFKVHLFKWEDKYKCIAVDELCIFSLWYTSKDIRKDSPIAAFYHLIEQYEYFTKLGKVKRDKIIKEINKNGNFNQILPTFSFLPLNSEYLDIFKAEYLKKQRDKSIEINLQDYLFGDTYFAEKIIKMGYIRIVTESDKLIFKLLDSPEPEIEIIDKKIRIGISEPIVLLKSDLTTLNWFAKLEQQDRKFFKVISFEDMKYHSIEQMKIWGQLIDIKDLNSWVIDRYERSKRSTELLLSIMEGKNN